jgi:hypothetical protein
MSGNDLPGTETYNGYCKRSKPFSVYALRVDKTPPDTMVDRVVMLLSTDWFLPYWYLIGIDASEPKLCVQKGCRQIVHEVMNGATNYYHTNFSDERFRATRQSICDLTRKCRLGESSEMSLEDLVDSRPEHEQFYKSAWLFWMLANNLAIDDQLDAAIKLVLERTRRKHSVMRRPQLRAAMLTLQLGVGQLHSKPDAWIADFPGRLLVCEFDPWPTADERPGPANASSKGRAPFKVSVHSEIRYRSRCGPNLAPDVIQ